MLRIIELPIFFLAVFLSLACIGSDLAVWSDGSVVWGFGPYNGISIYETTDIDIEFVNSVYQLDSTGVPDVQDLQTVVHFALVAGSEERFNELVAGNFGFGEHDCSENVDWEYVVDGCRDYQEAHWIAHCGLCGTDITEEMQETFDDREPEDDGHEGWY